MKRLADRAHRAIIIASGKGPRGVSVSHRVSKSSESEPGALLAAFPAITAFAFLTAFAFVLVLLVALRPGLGWGLLGPIAKPRFTDRFIDRFLQRFGRHIAGHAMHLHSRLRRGLIVEFTNHTDDIVEDSLLGRDD